MIFSNDYLKSHTFSHKKIHGQTSEKITLIKNKKTEFFESCSRFKLDSGNLTTR